jgi:hypothetical protein
MSEDSDEAGTSKRLSCVTGLVGRMPRLPVPGESQGRDTLKRHVTTRGSCYENGANRAHPCEQIGQIEQLRCDCKLLIIVVLY